MTTAREVSQLDDALQRVFIRNAFYRRHFHFILGFALLVLLFDAMLAGMVVYIARHPVQPLYFPADNAGRLIHEVPLSQPNHSNHAVSDWMVRAVETAYSYDFVNFQGQLQNAQQYFTTAGWREYMKGLEQSGNLVALKARKLVVTAKVVAVPKLVRFGLLPSGRLAWRFEVPVLMRYQMPPFDGKSEITNPLLVSVVVTRMDVLEGDEGLGIVQLNAFAAS